MQGCSVKINLALDALPDFTAYPGTHLGPHHGATMHICPSMDYIDRAGKRHRQDSLLHGRC